MSERNKSVGSPEEIDPDIIVSPDGNKWRIIKVPKSFFDYTNFIRDLQFGPNRDQPYREVPEEEAHEKWIAHCAAKKLNDLT